MTDSKELATLTAAEMDDIYLRNVPATILEQYATRLIAAYLKEQEPVATLKYQSIGGLGIENHAPDLLEAGMQLYLYAPSGMKAAGPEDRAVYDSIAANYNASTAPPEPAFPHCEKCGSSAWMCSVCHPRPAARAATSSEEVRDAVARLNDRFYDLDEGDCRRISDLIERLAARVPDGCVVVPREPTEEMIDAPRGFTQIIRGMTGCTFAQARAHCVNRGDNMLLWPEWARSEQGYVSEAGAALFIYQLMLAAGEAKPC